MRKLILLLSYIVVAASGAMAQTFVVNVPGGGCEAYYYGPADPNNETDQSPLEGTLQEAIYRYREANPAITRIEFDFATMNGTTLGCQGQGAQFEIGKNGGDLVIDASNVDFTINSVNNSTFNIKKNNVSIIGINFTGGMARAVLVDNVDNIVLQDLTITNPSNQGIQVVGASDDVIIQNVNINDANQHGIQFNNYSGTGAVVDSMMIANSGLEGILINGTTFSNVIISNSYIYGSNNSAINIENGSQIIIENNVIGLDQNGTNMPNGKIEDISTGRWVGVASDQSINLKYAGININSSSSFTIDSNVVSGNYGHGIYVSNTLTGTNKITGNMIGLNEDGTEVYGNFGDGILVENGSGVIIGEAGNGNYIAGNGNAFLFSPGDAVHNPNMLGNGVHLKEFANAQVYANYIGTNIQGTARIVGGVDYGNDVTGIYIHGSSDALVGGTNVNLRNVVGGNGYGFKDVFTDDSDGNGGFFRGPRHGILIHDDGGPANRNKISGNLVGIGADLISAIGNAEDQISLLGYSSGSNSNIIGGNTPSEGNIVGGGNFGVTFQGTSAVNNQIYNNYIGVTDSNGTAGIPTNQGGIKIQNGVKNTLIGAVGKGNYIEKNLGAGVIIEGATTNQNTILGNVTSCNDLGGINLINGGNNDHGPVYINVAEDRTTFISGFTPNNGDRIDIYIAGDCYPTCQDDQSSNLGQGKTYVGTVTAEDIATSVFDNEYGDGYWEFDISSIPEATKNNLVVTSTDVDGNTSEFNSCITKVSCSAPTSVTLNTKTTQVLCEGESTTISFSVVWPTSENGETHHYYLYKSDDYTNPVDSIVSSDNVFPKTFTVSDSGYYRIKGANLANENLCSLITPDSVRVRVGDIPTPGGIVASSTNDVCEDDLGRVYKVDSFEPGSTFIWDVEGASINGPSNRDSVVIDFDEGSGTIKLWVKEISGTPFACQSTDSTLLEINVNPLPAPVIVAPNPSECAADTIVYKVDNADPNSSFNWTVTGGTKLSEAADSVEVIWGTGVSGTVIVEETTEAGCIGTSSTTTVTINPRPVNPILSNTGSVCTLDDFTAQISNPGSRTFEWEITGGTPLTATGNPVTIKADGNPTDSIRIKITSTTSTGCSSIDPTYFAIGLNQRPVPGDISISPDLEACEADTITVSYFRSSASVTPAWSSTPASFLTDNAIGSYQGKESFQVVVAESASISVREISSDNCSTNPDSVKTVAFTMNAKPAVPLVTGPNPVNCADSVNTQTYLVDNFNSTSTYTWTPDANVRTFTESSDGSSADLTYGINPFNIHVEEETDKGCTNDTSFTVNVIGCVFIADFELSNGDTSICFPGNSGVDFVDKSKGVTSTTTYSWDFDINSDATSIPTVSSDKDPTGVVYNNPGTYVVRLIINDVIDGVQLTDTANIEVTIYDLPSITNITGPDEVCEGDTTIFSVNETDGSQYIWSLPTTWTKYAESSDPADSVTVVFQRRMAQSGDISVTEVDSNQCQSTLTKAIIVNTAPVSGGIISFDTDKCVGDTVTLNYTGVGASYIWGFAGTTDASFASPSTTNSIDVVLGTSTAKVTVLAISSEGCFSDSTSADSILTPIETPNPADYQIYGDSYNICENDTELYEVIPVNSDLDYEWQERGHALVTNGDSQIETIRPVADQSNIAVFLSIDGCRAKAPLVSDIIRKIPLPVIPNVSGINNPFCEDSTVLMNYNAIDSLNYSWTLSPAAGVSLESSRNGVGLDSLKFVVNPKEDWAGPDCPGITASLSIKYTTLPSNFDVGGCSSSDVYDIPVRFRIDKAELGIAYMDFEDNTYGYFCNKFDSRSDQEAELRAVVECDNTVDELSFAWETYQVVDNSGTMDTVLVNIRTANSDGDSLEIDFDQTPMDFNRDYNYVFRYSAVNPVCANDTGFSVNTLILEGADTVDFKLEDKIICAEDSSKIEVKNVLNYVNNPEIIYHYFYDLDTTSASYTSADSLFRFVEGDTAQYLTFAEDGFIDVDSISHLISATGDIIGYGYYLISKTPLEDSISVRAEPKYCVVNDSMSQVQFTDSLYLNVVNRPGGIVGGIDYGTSTDFRGLTRDELVAENTGAIIPDQLDLGQLEDNYVLLDAAENRDSNFVYASNNQIYYSWAYLNTDKYETITGANTDVLVHKPKGMPEEINYAMITSQIAATNDTVCTDTSYYSVTFEYIPWVPNIFSPNGDGNHDLFQIRNVEMYPETKVQIFNRWGSHLITIDYYDNTSHVWDGKVNGKDVSTGTYYYLVDFNIEGIDPVSGSVSIIR